MLTPLVSYDDFKTRITNLEEISDELGREELDILMFMSMQLGISGDSVHIEDSSLQGLWQLEDITELLQKYIRVFVACVDCGSLDTTLHVSRKRNTLRSTCGACSQKKVFTSPLYTPFVEWMRMHYS
jgi:translation initiation factor 2 beta subunit (eIF-2beta)/eIF-5